jgi:hypothetical protein
VDRVRQALVNTGLALLCLLLLAAYLRVGHRRGRRAAVVAHEASLDAGGGYRRRDDRYAREALAAGRSAYLANLTLWCLHDVAALLRPRERLTSLALPAVVAEQRAASTRTALAEQAARILEQRRVIDTERAACGLTPLRWQDLPTPDTTPESS